MILQEMSLRASFSMVSYSSSKDFLLSHSHLPTLFLRCSSARGLGNIFGMCGQIPQQTQPQIVQNK